MESEEQAILGRLRRTGLAPGYGFDDPIEAVRASCGLQAQDVTAVLLSLRARLSHPPSTAEELIASCMAPPKPTIVRYHSQRGTLHLQPTSMWEDFSALSGVLTDPRGHYGGSDDRADAAVLEKIASAGTSGATTSEIESGKEEKKHSVFRLSRTGKIAILLQRRGSANVLVARSVIAGSPSPTAAEPSFLNAIKAFIGGFGPVDEHDQRRQFGARAKETSKWVASLRAAGDIVDVKCGGRKGLFVLASSAIAPAGEIAPIVVLPPFDSFTLALADKTWLFHDSSSTADVFGLTGQIKGIVLVRGKAVLMWWYRKVGKLFSVKSVGLAGAPSSHISEAVYALKDQVPAMASFLGMKRHDFDFEDSEATDDDAGGKDDASEVDESDDGSGKPAPKKTRK